jgi:hypothetical protein
MLTSHITIKTTIISSLLLLLSIGFFVPAPVSADTSSNQQEQKLRLERLLTEIKGQTTTSLINRSSLVELKSSTKLAKTAGAKLSGKTIKKKTQGDITEDLRYINGQIWWKVKFGTSTVGWVPEKKLKRIPSTLLKIDTDKDGLPDSTVRFIGEYRSGFFGLKHVEGDTVVKYFKTKEDVAVAGYTIIPW